MPRTLIVLNDPCVIKLYLLFHLFIFKYFVLYPTRSYCPPPPKHTQTHPKIHRFPHQLLTIKLVRKLEDWQGYLYDIFYLNEEFLTWNIRPFDFQVSFSKSVICCILAHNEIRSVKETRLFPWCLRLITHPTISKER